MSVPAATRSAVDVFVARVAPITEANAAPLSFTQGGIVGSFIIQMIELTGEEILSTLLGDHNFDLIARPLPFLISSVTS